MPALDTTLILTGAVVFAASVTHGLAGFGAALVAMPLLVHWMDIKAVTPLVALLTLTINAVFLWRFRRGLQPHRIAFLLAGAAAGVPVGIVLLRQADHRLLEILLGIVLVAYAVRSLLTGRARAGMGPRRAILLGLVSGCLGGAINTAGPPAVVYTASQPWPKEEIHVTLQLYFFLCGLLIVSGHLLSGFTTPATLITYVLMLPPLAAGCAVGYGLHRLVSLESYHRLVFGLLLLLGALLLWR